MPRAAGARMWDVDGNEFIDYVGSWGPMILGHAHPRVIEAAQQALASGTSFGAPTELEVRMAELICSIVPSIEMVRMVNSGTEATMSAVRLARAFTRREQDHQVRGVLPRPRRLVPDQGRIRRNDPERPGQPGRSCGRRGGNADRGLQRSRLGENALRSRTSGTRSPRSSSSRSSGTWDASRRSRDSSKGCGSSARTKGSC